MSASERFIIVDVGRIECGEQTEVLGIFSSREDASSAFESFAATRDIKEWEPRGGILEFFGNYQKTETTYMGGCGYFSGGQHALEVHVYPPRPIQKAEEGA